MHAMVSQGGFVLRRVVGRCLDGNATVSKAESVGTEKKGLLAKRLHRNLDAAETQTLEREISMSAKLKEVSNILACEEHFVHGAYLYVIMPEVKGSLYYLMRTRFCGGVAERHILVILHRVLTVVSAAHELGHTHGKLCAAHVYVDRTGIIRVGYAASIFEHYSDTAATKNMHAPMTASPFWPATALWELAAAPEADKSFEADIWMIGVIALELIHLGIRVTKREEFDDAVAKILKERKIPGRLVETYKSFRNYFGFSDEFVKLVASCFERDPKNRPTAKELQTWDIFSDPLSAHQPRDFMWWGYCGP